MKNVEKVFNALSDLSSNSVNGSIPISSFRLCAQSIESSLRELLPGDISLGLPVLQFVDHSAGQEHDKSPPMVFNSRPSVVSTFGGPRAKNIRSINHSQVPFLASAPKQNLRKPSYAEKARAALAACEDVSTRPSIAIKHLFGPKPRAPMSRRLLPEDAVFTHDFEKRLRDVEIVHFRGLTRMPFSDLRALFGELGFENRELLHFSFIGGGITGIMCSTREVAERLKQKLSSVIKGNFLENLDPSKPLPRVDGSLPEFSEENKSFARSAFIKRVTREILSSSDLLVATILQRNVEDCAREITTSVRGSSSRNPRSSVRTQ
jgi:hypothetical protein